jgi:N-glycosylase/DNA lyase
MQRIGAAVGGEIRFVDIPSQSEEVLPGVRWGDASLILTPAWIAKHAHLRRLRGEYDNLFCPKHNTLAEDVVFCLLGGFGIKAEVAAAAYRALRAAGLFETRMTFGEILAELRSPLNVGTRKVRYRFPGARARYIEAALIYLEDNNPPSTALELRNFLLPVTGIGLKTASYVVRNHLASNDVAILDVHVVRAAQIACMFPEKIRLPADYGRLEAIFLRFAAAARIPAACLDLTLWEIMRRLSQSQKLCAQRLNRQQLLAGGPPPTYVDRVLWQS